MYLVYVDESGDDGLSPGGTDFFVISGLIVHESYWNEIFARFLDLRRNLSRTYAVPQRIAFHATDIVNGHGEFHHSQHGLQTVARFNMYREIIEFLAQLQEIRVLNVCIKKTLIGSRTTPVFAYAWQKFIERFHTFLEKGGSGLETNNDYGMLITDRTHDDQLRRLMRKLRAFNYVPSMFGGSPHKLLITRLLDDPVPRNSIHSYFIQMADLIAYTLARKAFPRRSLKCYRFETYFDMLEPILLKEASYSDAQGVVYWPTS